MRSTLGSLAAVVVATVGISALVCGLRNETDAASPDFDPWALSFFGANFGQVAAISFGALTVPQEFHNSAVRVSLAAVPCRGLFYAARMATVGGVTLVVGVITGLITFLLGQALIGESGISMGDTAAMRAVVGSGIYLALMALFAVGLTALLRSGITVLSLLIPFILIFPFVFNDVASGVIAYLPDGAGRLLVRQFPQGPVGPWTGLAVTALWASAALLAGWIALELRDA